MANLTVQVDRSTDDVWRRLTNSDAISLTTGGFTAGAYNDVQARRQEGSGALFRSIAIPPNATILNAYLILTAYGTNATEGVKTRISAEAEDNPATFTDDKVVFDARWANRTSASVNWDDIEGWVGGTEYHSPDIKSVIQEIVNRSGWVSGNSLVIFWEDFDDRSGVATGCYRTSYQYDDSIIGAPQLYIEFSGVYYCPTVSIQAMTDKTSTTATANGNVTALGSPLAYQHGHIWATFPNPLLETVGDNKTELGIPSATGTFESSLTNLSKATLYYVRAYIKSTIGTFYSDQLSTFTTSVDKPTVTTNDIRYVYTTSAEGYGSIDNDGGSAIIAHGICWDTSANPLYNSTTSVDKGGTSVLGEFHAPMTDLTEGQEYHWRAWAQNSSGVEYGDDKTFTTTSASAPLVSTDAFTSEADTYVIGHGTLISRGGANITAYGHVWDTSEDPKTSLATKTTLASPGSLVNGDTFQSNITDLKPNTTYYVRAYAINSYDGGRTAYGNNKIIKLGAIAGELKGNLGVKGEFLMYTSHAGTQRALLGQELA